MINQNIILEGEVTCGQDDLAHEGYEYYAGIDNGTEEIDIAELFEREFDGYTVRVTIEKLEVSQ